MLRTRRNKLEFAGRRYSSSSIRDVIEDIRSESRQRYACGNGGVQGCRMQTPKDWAVMAVRRRLGWAQSRNLENGA